MMLTSSNALKSSAMYIGYLILKAGITSSRQLILGLSFLYSVDIVEFEEANIWVKK